jgi:hypothetical protein
MSNPLVKRSVSNDQENQLLSRVASTKDLACFQLYRFGYLRASAFRTEAIDPVRLNREMLDDRRR